MLRSSPIVPLYSKDNESDFTLPCGNSFETRIASPDAFPAPSGLSPFSWTVAKGALPFSFVVSPAKRYGKFVLALATCSGEYLPVFPVPFQSVYRTFFPSRRKSLFHFHSTRPILAFCYFSPCAPHSGAMLRFTLKSSRPLSKSSLLPLPQSLKRIVPALPLE